MSDEGEQNEQRQEPELPDDPEQLRSALLEERRRHATLLNEVKKAKADRRALSDKLKGWNQLEGEGLTQERARDLARREREGIIERNPEVDQLLAGQRQRHEAEKAALAEQITQHTRVIERLTIDATLDRELDKLVDPRLKAGAARLHRDKVKLVEDEGSETGLRAVVKLGSDDFMSVDEYLKEWAASPEGQPYLKPSLAGGGGAMAGNGRVRKQIYRRDLTAAEKSEIITRDGKEAYDRLPWAPTK